MKKLNRFTCLLSVIVGVFLTYTCVMTAQEASTSGAFDSELSEAGDVALPAKVVTAASAAAAESSAVIESAGETEIVEIDWMDKLKQGGFTMLALAMLSIAALAFSIERLIGCRLSKVAPRTLSDQLRPLAEAQDYEGIMAACNEHPSTLARVIRYVVEHRHNAVDLISAGAGDIGGREIRDLLAKVSPLAVIASLAPLLGLLGTMIGMIEAFELVAIYGDDGGASMLAASIAKALITTAVGLIVAIPVIASYHFFKHRINHLTNELETEVESVIACLFLKRSEEDAQLEAEVDKALDAALEDVLATAIAPSH